MAPPPPPPAPAPKSITLGTTLTPDLYAWNDIWGGAWTSAANWYDSTLGAVATAVPGAANAVAIIGGTGGAFTDITGSGAAAAVAIQNDVLIWGTVSVTGALALALPSGSGTAADLELDSGAHVTAASLSVASGNLEATSASTVTVSGTAVLNQSFLLATDGSALKLGSLVENDTYNAGSVYVTPLLAVDDISSIQIGSVASPKLGAITVAAGQTATVSGAIEGNVVLSGVVAIQAGNTLAIDRKDPYGTATGVTGTGSLVIAEASTAYLGVADSAAIAFAGPAGTLLATVAPTGTISGFTSGDLIELPVAAAGTSVATGLGFQQLTSNTGRVTLSRAGVTVGTLALAGSYGTSLFHLSLDATGDDLITVAPLGVAPVQPGVITGTAGSDTLYATANNQILTGLGGGDLLQALTFTGIDFKDTSADLNGSTISGFGVTDTIDLTDMKPATASLGYTPANLSALAVSDGTHAATLAIGLAGALPAGWFAAVADGSGGTDVEYVTVNTDTYVFGPSTSGTYAAAANWFDSNTGTIAATAPSYGNVVSIAGGSGYTGVIGNGVAGSIQAGGHVLLWGSLTVGGNVSGTSGALSETGTLELDGGARLALAGTAGIGGMTEIGGGSALTAGGLSFAAGGAALLAVGGGVASFTGVLGAAAGNGLVDASVIGVDATSSIEIGPAGTAAKGALTIDPGIIADLLGTIEGNVAVNGTLAVLAGGALSITGFGTATASVTGSGTMTIGNGATLTLNGPDSAAVLFGPVSGSGNVPGALVLNGALPTGTIAGFAKGDSIVLARTVTGLTYAQTTSGQGTLALLDGSASVGSLTLAGSFVASQFLISPSADARASTITYMAASGTTSGSPISDNTDTYAWNTGTGGSWGNAANWLDSTTGLVPGSAPGAGNAVVMPARTGGILAAEIVSGFGSATSVLDGMDSVITGTLAIGGLFEVQGYQSEALLQAGATVTVGSLDDQSTVALVGHSTLIATGTLAANIIQGTLTATGGSLVRLSGAGSLYGTLAVDTLSSLEIGTLCAAASGLLTIDPGQTLAAYASLIEANLAVNGGIVVTSATVTAEGFAGSVGTVLGGGTITLSSADLILDDADSAAIAFGSGLPSTLELAGPLPTGTISGFASGDVLKFDQTVTGASFTQSTASQGKLTLTDGSATVGTLTLNGSFTGALFVLDVAASSGVSTLSLQSAIVPSVTSAAGTGSDAFAWGGASGGGWATAANWTDTTKGTAATTSPSALDAVTIAGASGANQYVTIGGNGTAASLGITGGVLLKGTIGSAGLVTLAAAADLTLNGGAVLSAGSAIVAGRLEIEAASTAKIANAMTLNGGALLLIGGSTLTAAGLLGTGSGNAIAIDANSAVHIGSSTTAAAGALTQAAGSAVAISGAIYGSVAANGTLAVEGGASLFIDLSGTVEHDPYAIAPTIGGTGTLSIAEGSTLGMGVADTAAIQFAGPNGVLLLATPSTGTISGFAVGDQIQIDQSVGALSYHQGTAGTGTLTLTRGGATIGTLTLSGTYGTGNAFHLDVQANSDIAVISLKALGIAVTQPTLILGTAGTDTLSATANGQTLTGLPGPDTLNGNGFTGLVFKDMTANMAGDVIAGFATSDYLDLTDMTSSSAAVHYLNGVLSVTDGTHSASLTLGFAATPATGSFHVAADGGGGTKLTWS